MIGDTTLRVELFIDPHSFSSPEATVTHLEWDAEVDFDAQEIHATAVWTLSEAHGDQVVLIQKHFRLNPSYWMDMRRNGALELKTIY